MKTFTFTNTEIEVLQIALSCPTICASDCAVENMQNSKKGCDDCWFNSMTYSLIERLDNKK